MTEESDFYKLRDWISIEKLDIWNLCKNPHIGIVSLLKNKKEKLNIEGLCHNPYGVELLTPKMIHENHTYYWLYLLENTYAFYFIKKYWKEMWHDISKFVEDAEFYEHHLTKNHHPDAIKMIETYLNEDKHGPEITFYFSLNPSAIPLLEKYPEIIDWLDLCRNPNAIHLLEKNPDKIFWKQLSLNPNAIPILEKNQDKICWELLSTNPSAIPLLKQNQDKIDWEELSSNPNAIHLLEANPDKIDWCELCQNPNAIHLIERNIEEKYKTIYYWTLLCENPNAIHILEKHQDKICWEVLSENPSIFTYNYQAIRDRCNIFKEELIQVINHPQNALCFHWLNLGDEEDLKDMKDTWHYDDSATLKIRPPSEEEMQKIMASWKNF